MEGPVWFISVCNSDSVGGWGWVKPAPICCARQPYKRSRIVYRRFLGVGCSVDMGVVGLES